MGLIHEISRSRGIRLIEVGALGLVTAADFLSFVEGCREREVVILGIEGFRFHDGAAIPDMGAIADFSELSHENLAVASAQEATRFFRELKPAGMGFDFVLSEKGQRA